MPSNALPVAKIDESQSLKKRDRKTVGTVFSLSLLSRLVFVSPGAKQAASLVSCRRHLLLLYLGPPNAPHLPDIAATFRGEDYANYHFLCTELRSPIASLEATQLLDRIVPCLQCSVSACDCFDCLECERAFLAARSLAIFCSPRYYTGHSWVRHHPQPVHNLPAVLGLYQLQLRCAALSELPVCRCFASLLVLGAGFSFHMGGCHYSIQGPGGLYGEIRHLIRRARDTCNASRLLWRVCACTSANHGIHTTARTHFTGVNGKRREYGFPHSRKSQ